MYMHNDFTLFLRVYPNGKKTVFYYVYDENGVRRGPWTTKQTSITLARNYCNKLNRAGLLLPKQTGKMLFAEYAEGWWVWDTCKYLKKRRKRHNITRSYADNNKKMMTNQLIPFFGKMAIGRITPEEIENWIDYMAEQGYQNTYTNTIFGTLKTMMIEAVARKIITSDPTENMERLVNDRKDIKIITQEEFKALFVKDWKRVWDNDRICYTTNKLAALTGMRTSEVLGLKGENVFDDHIYLCKQYDEYGYRDTKTKDKHNIPLAPDIIADLEELIIMNGKGFLFSLDGGGEPICRRTMYDGFHRALNNIGIDDTQISERNLHLHAWRHFCNTELLKAGVPISKVQSVTSHKSDRMTDWYSHFDPNEFSEVRKAQEDLLAPAEEKAGKGKGGKDTARGAARKAARKADKKTKAARKAPVKTRTEKSTQGAKIIKMPERGKVPVRKRA
jgi:integrase